MALAAPASTARVTGQARATGVVAIRNATLITATKGTVQNGTIVLRDDRAFIQAGAGIVYDSVPEREYDECVNKAAALGKAVRLARGALARRNASATVGEVA